MLYESIRAVSAAGHQVVLIGTCNASPEYDIREGHFKQLANTLDCDFFCDAAINRQTYRDRAVASQAEVAISVNWLTLVGRSFRAAFEHGVVNAHAGDLPRFRGNAAPNWAILAGENRVVA